MIFFGMFNFLEYQKETILIFVTVQMSRDYIVLFFR